MFCAFDGPPRILQLHGRGEAIEPGDEQWEYYHSLLPQHESPRSIIVLHVDRISDSCGYGVPLYEYVGGRHQLSKWCERKGPAGILEYQAKKNRLSIDRLPGLKR